MTEYMQELLGDNSTFAVDNDREADWAIEKILKHEAERDRLLSLANEKIKEITEQKAKFIEKCENDTAYLKMLLRAYFEYVQPSTDTKTQRTYKLLSGKLVLKRQGPEFIQDEPAMLAWAEASAPGFIRIKKEIAWVDLKKATALDGEVLVFAETGEIIPGVTAKARDDVFEVTK